MLFYYSYRRGKVHVPSRPLKIWVEPTNACNLLCKICPQSDGGFPTKGLMDVYLINKIASELRTIDPLIVTLHLSGEPLIHPHIGDLIKILKKETLNVTFSTNGVLLTKEKIDELIESGLDDIRIDFAADKKKFEEVRQKAVWETVYKNILALLEIKKERKLFKPRVLIINIDITDDPREVERNLKDLKKLFNGYPAEILNLELHTWAGEFAEKAGNGSLYKRFSHTQAVQSHYFPCPHIFGSFVISWNGDVVPCCRDLKKDYIIGNIKDKTIMELWNSERLMSLRKMQLSKRYKEIPLCRACDQLWCSYTLSKLAKNSLQKALYLTFGHSLGIGKTK